MVKYSVKYIQSGIFYITPCDKMATCLSGSGVDEGTTKDLLTILLDYAKQKERRNSLSSLHEGKDQFSIGGMFRK